MKKIIASLMILFISFHSAYGWEDSFLKVRDESAATEIFTVNEIIFDDGALTEDSPGVARVVGTGGGGGGGGSITAQLNDITIGTNVTTFDFSTLFTLSESPSQEINVGLNATTLEPFLEAFLDLEDLQGGVTVSNISATTLVIESEGIASNDNDTTIPTSAAVKDYADTNDDNTNASTICSGTTTYLDGEGNCDDISSVYESSTSNDIDPDRITGDTNDDDLLDPSAVNWTGLQTKVFGAGSPFGWYWNTGTNDPQINWTDGAILVNPDGADVDFQVGSQDKANLFTVDAESNTVALRAAPEAGTVFGIFNPDTTQGYFTIVSGASGNLDGGFIYINQAARDIDTKIAGDVDSNLFYADAGNSRVGISDSTPDALFDVGGHSKVYVDGTDDAIFADDVEVADNVYVGEILYVGHDSDSAGVSITSDGDGAITFQGQSLGNDEDFTLNLDDFANTIQVSSSTGVDLFDFATSSINISVPTEPYDATGWNANATVPQKNDIRDYLETLSSIASNSSANPFLRFYDSDGVDDDINAQIDVNLTNTGSGTENANMNLGVQQAGTLTTKLRLGHNGVSLPEFGVNWTNLGTLIDTLPNTDETMNGKYTNDYTASTNITKFQTVYFDTSGGWSLADADAASTSGGVMLGMALETKTTGNNINVAFDGFIRDDTFNWTKAAPLYVSTTAGDLTETAPSGTDDVVRVVGYAMSADVIRFDPSKDYITLN